MARQVRATKSATSTMAPVGEEVQLFDGVLDLDESSEVIPFNYSITGYGTDFPVDALVKRMRDKDIHVPIFGPKKVRGAKVRFQRQYVWSKQQADRFVESLLLGLPVPGIFLMKEDSGRHLVLDGHQRLRTLQRYFDNKWEDEDFPLSSVQQRFVGKRYGDLAPLERRRLNDAVIHATIIKQDDPAEDLSSVYLIFERLNSGGTSLQPQEIRVALYHGAFADLLVKLNADSSWRTLVGRQSARLKDMELVLRFFALLEARARYERPMKGFLNRYMAKRKDVDAKERAQLSDVFMRTTALVVRSIGPKALRLKSSVNAALADAVLVGVATRLGAKSAPPKPKGLKDAYSGLVKDEGFLAAISKATADEENVRSRLAKAIAAFENT